MQNPLLILASVAVLVACGGSDGKSSAITSGVYKYAGSVQCETGGLSLADGQRQLNDAGIEVLAAYCGSDGMLYPAVCGGADGRIRIYEVPNAQAQAASAVGFSSMSRLPSAARDGCQ